MSITINRYNKIVHLEVIKAYLYEAKSHRHIQETILGVEAPSRGGGFLAMEILHHYGISGKKKGVLKFTDLLDEFNNAKGVYKNTLELLLDSL